MENSGSAIKIFLLPVRLRKLTRMPTRVEMKDRNGEFAGIDPRTAERLRV